MISKSGKQLDRFAAISFKQGSMEASTMKRASRSGRVSVSTFCTVAVFARLSLSFMEQGVGLKQVMGSKKREEKTNKKDKEKNEAVQVRFS
ncbi:hypothetical protein, partial [Paenibacillus macerans]|uniref:hypothetical protein n=1 Tax=Paenibacillus macerans TaxID=44252 RepID=UPI0022E73B27